MSIFSIPFGARHQMLRLNAGGFDGWYLNCQLMGVPPPPSTFDATASSFMRARRMAAHLLAGRSFAALAIFAAKAN